MNKRDLDRYKRMLLERRSEMSVTSAEAESPIPAAGGHRGDPVDQASANTEAELQIQLHQTDLRLLRAIEEALARIRLGAFGVCEVLDTSLSRLQRARTFLRQRNNPRILQIARPRNFMSSRAFHVQPNPSSKFRESFVEVHGERPQREDHERRLAGTVVTSPCSGTRHIEGRFGFCPRPGSVVVWRIDVQGIAGDSFALITHEAH
jgi:DnaK suppressor protein